MVRERMGFDCTGRLQRMCVIRKGRKDRSPRKLEEFLAPVT
jgi:hypothetical protein